MRVEGVELLLHLKLGRGSSYGQSYLIMRFGSAHRADLQKFHSFSECLHFILTSRSPVADINPCDALYTNLCSSSRSGSHPLFLALHFVPGAGMTQGPGWPKRGVMETHNTAIQARVRSKL